MELWDWILVGVLATVTIIFFFKYLLTVMLYFRSMDFDQVTTRRVKVPVGDVELDGKLLLPKKMEAKQLPLIISMNGFGEHADMVLMMQYSAAFAVSGPYAVLNVTTRGFGKSPGKRRLLMQQIWDDVPKVIDFATHLPEIDPARIGYFGKSMGGQIGVSRMYQDPRVKAIVALCSPFNMKANFGRTPESFGVKITLKSMRLMGGKAEKISDEFNRSVSPEFIIDPKRPDMNQRVFLVHARDDQTIAFSEFEKLRAALNLPDNQVLALEHGNHIMMRQEMLITASALRFFATKL